MDHLHERLERLEQRTHTVERQLRWWRGLAGSLIVLAVLTWTLGPMPSALAGQLPATGQTTSYPADQNDGIDGPVTVPDDGALQRGATLRYKVLNDGTIKDQNTGLIWEVKCSGCGGLHDVDNGYVWSGDGTEETIWDWLEDINSENGGDGYAGHNDRRIPNIRELQSIVDYGRNDPAIDPMFGPTAAAFYWSSTTTTREDMDTTCCAWSVSATNGLVFDISKPLDHAPVRAVRGGPK